jgi:hypothetical protein
MGELMRAPNALLVYPHRHRVVRSVSWALAASVVALAAGCGSGHRIVVVAPGRVGPLRTDGSSAADVIAFAGRPDVDRRGSVDDGPPYRALGYECSRKRSDDLFPPVLETASARVHGPYCKTVFWINLRTRRLGEFYTASGRYSESNGVRIGMKTGAAERLLHKRVTVGCEALILLGNKGTLAIPFAGGSIGRPGPSGALPLVGGRVEAFALEGHHSAVGIFDCF